LQLKASGPSWPSGDRAIVPGKLRHVFGADTVL